MVYDFVAKIKAVEKTDLLTDEALQNIVAETDAVFGNPAKFDIYFILPDAAKPDSRPDEFLVKSQTSVSTMAAYHDKELEIAVQSFRTFIEEIARTVVGEISTSDGFYNNSKTFKRLYAW